MQLLGKLVMRGPLYAIAVAGLLGVLSLLVLPCAILSAAIIALVQLRKGGMQALAVIIGTLVFVTIGSEWIATRPGLDFPILIILLVPVYLGAMFLRGTESQGIAISVIIACAAGFALSVQIYSGDAALFWSDWLKEVMTGMQNITFEGFEKNDSLSILNGIIAMLLGFAAVSSLLLARWMQSALYNPGGFKQEFYHLSTPRMLFWNIVGLLGIIFLVDELLFKNLFIVLASIYFFQGVAVMHCNVSRLRRSPVNLLLPYFLMIFVPQFVIAGMACMGMVDVFLNFRKLPG